MPPSKPSKKAEVGSNTGATGATIFERAIFRAKQQAIAARTASSLQPGSAAESELPSRQPDSPAPSAAESHGYRKAARMTADLDTRTPDVQADEQARIPRKRLTVMAVVAGAILLAMLAWAVTPGRHP